MSSLPSSPRNDVYNALAHGIFEERKLIEQMSRAMPRNADVVRLKLVHDKVLADLAHLRSLLNVHQPIKRRDQDVNKRRRGRKRDGAKLMRRHRAKKAAEAAALAAARMRVDPNDLPALVVT